MCTIVIRHGLDYFARTVIAANRDEFIDRPSSGPQVLHDSPKIIGGRDERGGGTWLGVRPDGVFMAVTNQRNWGMADASLKSRGELVLDALKHADFNDMCAWVASLDARGYNEFNLMYGDGPSLFVAYGRHSEPHPTIEKLRGDTHVLTNDRMDRGLSPKADRIKKGARKIPRSTWAKLRPRLVDVLTHHDTHTDAPLPEPPADSPIDSDMVRALQATCIHSPVYGTRSAVLLAVKKGKVVHYEFAEGRPCEHEFESAVHLFG